mmetsp:Transcript_38326/g.71376  ORF Transcript_38326/g.71376 Transcript_38326/m.71376 type:complete len:237 (-) Transcript_38326:32-742(-)
MEGAPSNLEDLWRAGDTAGCPAHKEGRDLLHIPLVYCKLLQNLHADREISRAQPGALFQRWRASAALRSTAQVLALMSLVAFVVQLGWVMTRRVGAIRSRSFDGSCNLCRCRNLCDDPAPCRAAVDFDKAARRKPPTHPRSLHNCGRICMLRNFMSLDLHLVVQDQGSVGLKGFDDSREPRLLRPEIDRFSRLQRRPKELHRDVLPLLGHAPFQRDRIGDLWLLPAELHLRSYLPK